MRKVVRLTAVVAVLAIVGAACSKSSTPQTSSVCLRGSGDPGRWDAEPRADERCLGGVRPAEGVLPTLVRILQVLPPPHAASDEGGPGRPGRQRAAAGPRVGAADGLERWSDVHVLDQAGHPLLAAAPRRGGHRRGLRPRHRARGRPEGELRRIPVLLLGDRRVRRLRSRARPIRSAASRLRTTRRSWSSSRSRPATCRGDSPCRPPRRSRRTRPTRRPSSASRRDTPPTTAGSSSAPARTCSRAPTRSTSPCAASDQEPVSGYVPGRSMILVRNPSYDPSTDGLRPAYPDRIETTIGGDVADLYNKVETGEMSTTSPMTAPPANVLQQYATNPDKQPYLHTTQQNAVPVHLDEPGRAAVRRHPCPQGGQPGLRQSGEPPARRWSAHRGRSRGTSSPTGSSTTS